MSAQIQNPELVSEYLQINDEVLFNKKNKVYFFVKRLLDIVLSLFALLVLLPFLVILAILIRVESPGNPVFTQTRVGKNGKEFKMYKFRSMCVDAEEKKKDLQRLNEEEGPVFKIREDPRITKIGKFIRKFSIDELLQLINILKGEMSIIGPRPALPEEVKEYNDFARLRLMVKPGLSCYWQIMGRSDIGFYEWMQLDVKYINEMSLWTDFKITVLTFPVVLFGKGAY